MSGARFTRVRGLASALICLLGALVAPRAAEAKTVYFPHQDAHFLFSYQHKGGAALVPEGAPSEKPLPLVVFLHGTNPHADLHVWMGGAGKDLRPLVSRLIHDRVVEPFVFAAPSHTKNAGLARTVWQGFDLNEFVEDTASAMPESVSIDRERVVLAGHSGAGCNPHGGLAADYWSAGTPLPLALVSVDPCLDRKMGRAFAQRPEEVPLLLWWQSAIWARHPARFRAALGSDKPEGRIDRLLQLPGRGINPHEAILPVALESALRELLAPQPSE